MTSERVSGWTIALLLAAATGFGLINPNFTPRHLVDQSDVVLAGTVSDSGDGKQWALAKTASLKGQVEGGQTLSLGPCDPDQVEQIRGMLKTEGGAGAILFVGAAVPNEEPKAYLHVAGTWLAAKAGTAKNAWDVTGFASNMSEVYVGGTDQLLRMCRYLLKSPNADVPSTAGVRWAQSHIPVGKIEGPSSGLAAVELGAEHRVCVFAGAPGGDRLFQPTTANYLTSFRDVTADAGLDTKSRAFAWIDLNGDGVADLVSDDDAAVSVRFGTKDGKFTAAGAGWTVKPHDGWRTLTPCSLDGKPAVLASGSGVPELLVASQDTGWEKVVLPAAATDVGQLSVCLAGDFNGDGYVDVIEPGERDGLFWAGKKGGFENPVPCGVCTGGGAAKAMVGDYNEDGAPDIFLAGPEHNSLWENDGKGTFRNVLQFAGSMSYKCEPGASDVQTMDLGQDGRQDVCLIYPGGKIAYHFNRGFRCFGEEGEVRLPGLTSEVGQQPVRLAAMTTGDFDGSSSQDLVLLLATGELYAYLNAQSDMPSVRLRLPKGRGGSVTVSCWQGDEFPVCCGTTLVGSSSPGVTLTVRAMGEVTLKWTEPGAAEGKTKRVVVANETADVTVE